MSKSDVKLFIWFIISFEYLFKIEIENILQTSFLDFDLEVPEDPEFGKIQPNAALGEKLVSFGFSTGTKNELWIFEERPKVPVLSRKEI